MCQFSNRLNVVSGKYLSDLTARVAMPQGPIKMGLVSTRLLNGKVNAPFGSKLVQRFLRNPVKELIL